MPKYEQQADFDAASGADEAERESTFAAPNAPQRCNLPPCNGGACQSDGDGVVRRTGPALSERIPCIYTTTDGQPIHTEVAKLEAQLRHARPSPLRPLEEWHEDYGPALWWKLPVDEPPWFGSPLDDDWVEDYYTHWQEIPCPTEPGE